MNPIQMLDHKADLLARLTDPEVRRAWSHHVALDWKRSNEDDGKAKLDEDDVSNGAACIYSFGRGLQDATCFHVSEEMSKLVVFAASQLEELDRISYEIIPTRAGLVRFDSSLPFTDVRGKSLKIGWACWVPVEVRHSRYGEPSESVLLFMFNDHIDDPDQIFNEMLEESRKSGLDEGWIRSTFGRWGMICCENLADGQRLGPAYVPASPKKAAEILESGDVPVDFTNYTRMIHALWLLLGQKITTRSEADIPRPMRKRAERRAIPPRVVVIGLRTREGGRSEGESMVEWSHRWVVRGHWRWQVVSKYHPLAQEITPGEWRARIWVAPFVKGPADKPLVVSEKVYAFHR